jgi:hypothetical protein
MVRQIQPADIRRAGAAEVWEEMKALHLEASPLLETVLKVLQRLLTVFSDSLKVVAGEVD